MTTDIEKQFFDTFNIEKRQVDCEQLLRLDCDNKDCKTCKYSIYDYPEITDGVLLKLVYIWKMYETLPYFKSYDDFKHKILTYLTRNYDSLSFYKDERAESLKHQVRTLFEEG